MGNMSYCRFRNTLGDLQDCYESWEEATEPDEKRAQARLLVLCQRILADYGQHLTDED